MAGFFNNREIHGEFTAPIHGHIVLKKHCADERLSLRKKSPA